jgi:hypothetical protein
MSALIDTELSVVAGRGGLKLGSAPVEDVETAVPAGAGAKFVGFRLGFRGGGATARLLS